MIDFNELRLVRKYGSWRKVAAEFDSYLRFEVHDDFETPEAAWQAFLKQEDEDGEA